MTDFQFLVTSYCLDVVGVQNWWSTGDRNLVDGRIDSSINTLDSLTLPVVHQPPSSARL